MEIRISIDRRGRALPERLRQSSHQKLGYRTPYEAFIKDPQLPGLSPAGTGSDPAGAAILRVGSGTSGELEDSLYFWHKNGGRSSGISATFCFGFVIVGYLNRDLVLWKKTRFAVLAVFPITPYLITTAIGGIGVILTTLILRGIGKKDTAKPAIL